MDFQVPARKKETKNGRQEECQVTPQKERKEKERGRKEGGSQVTPSKKRKEKDKGGKDGKAGGEPGHPLERYKGGVDCQGPHRKKIQRTEGKGRARPPP